LRDAGAGAVFVLLAGSTADPTGALDDAIAYDRNRSLGHDHVTALRRRKPAQCWHVGTHRHFAAGAAECRRDDGIISITALERERHAEIYPRDEYIGRAEFCRDAVCLPVLRVVERAAVPVVEASGL
jgi:hypothetical protein